MPELRIVQAEHGPAILAFELENREYFAESISDRGDDYFDHFTEQHNQLLARRSAGHGTATAAVIELCRLAAVRHGLTTLRAATSDQNVASRRVLIKAGFSLDSPADPADIGGKQGRWYRMVLPAARAIS